MPLINRSSNHKIRRNYKSQRKTGLGEKSAEMCGSDSSFTEETKLRNISLFDSESACFPHIFHLISTTTDSNNTIISTGSRNLSPKLIFNLLIWWISFHFSRINKVIDENCHQTRRQGHSRRFTTTQQHQQGSFCCFFFYFCSFKVNLSMKTPQLCVQTVCLVTDDLFCYLFFYYLLSRNACCVNTNHC